MPFPVMDVAKYIINYCADKKKPISNLKLQKLLYYLWINYYKRVNTYIFNDSIFAWPFGPVIPDVYYEYCTYGGISITKQEDFDSPFSEDETMEINELLNKYIDYSPNKLVNMSHEPGKPWDVIYNQEHKYKEEIPFDLIIRLECQV